MSPDMKRRWIIPSMIAFGASLANADDDQTGLEVQSTEQNQEQKRWGMNGSNCNTARNGSECASRNGANCRTRSGNHCGGSSVVQYGASCGVRNANNCGAQRNGTSCW